MKHIVAVSAALLFAGCASTMTPTQQPYYDAQSGSVFAEGFPVSRISPPSHFEYQRNHAESSQREHSTPGPSGSADTESYGYAWVDAGNDTAVMTALLESLDSGSRFLPQSASSGYEFKGDQRFIYNERWGRYSDMAGDASVIPANAPECAATVDLLAVSRNERQRFVGVYSEGVPCDEVNRLSRNDWDQLRQRAYGAYGVN
jgi:hypothetical protein